VVAAPFPGPAADSRTSKVAHVEENCAAAAVTLDDETFDALDALRD